jgi:hypothetical protein
MDARAIVPRPLAWGLIVILMLLLGGMILPLNDRDAPAGEPAFTDVLWQRRGLDVIAQIMLPFPNRAATAWSMSSRPWLPSRLPLRLVQMGLRRVIPCDYAAEGPSAFSFFSEVLVLGRVRNRIPSFNPALAPSGSASDGS